MYVKDNFDRDRNKLMSTLNRYTKQEGLIIDIPSTKKSSCIIGIECMIEKKKTAEYHRNYHTDHREY